MATCTQDSLIIGDDEEAGPDQLLQPSGGNRSVSREPADPRSELSIVPDHTDAPTIDNLPPETMSDIFEFYAPWFIENQNSYVCETETPLRLGAVCQRWRQIAWSAPSLWTTLIMRSSQVHLSAVHVDLAEEWLGRSGTLPLSIKVEYPNLRVTRRRYRLDRLFAIINAVASRWQRLYISLYSGIFDGLKGSATVTPTNLQELVLRPQRIRDVSRNLTHLTPQILDIYGISDPLIFNWSHVTQLTADRITNYALYSILQLAPHLQKCRLALCRSDKDPTDGASQRISHGLITHLEITFHATDNARFFFQYVDLPALAYLRIGTDFFFLDYFTAILPRLNPGLKTLGVVMHYLSIEHLIEIAHAVPLLECLEVEDQDGSHVQHVLTTLGGQFPPGNTALALAWPLLPSLREFHWSGNKVFPWALLRYLFVSLSEDNDNRRPLKLIKIHCHRRRRSDPIPYIDKDVLSGLSKFADSVQFQFYVDLDNGCGDLWEMSQEKALEGGV